MTKQALEKLNEKQMNYCKTISCLIDRARKNGLKEEYEKNSGKLRGFLECMCQMEIISGTELKGLYLYFFSENRYGNRIKWIFKPSEWQEENMNRFEIMDRLKEIDDLILEELDLEATDRTRREAHFAVRKAIDILEENIEEEE